MKNALLTSIVLGAVSTAAGVEIEKYHDSLMLHFEEPVVLQSELNSGADKFTLTGDTAHLPTARWVDQNRLRVDFAPGTSVFTEFRLAFKPGQDKYLSGESMEQREFRFTCPRSTLRTVQIPGTAVTTYCVFPESRVTKEAQEFSASTPVQYEFSYVTEENEERTKIAGTTEPARLGILPTSCRSAALRILKEQNADWKQVNADTIVPGFVIVRAAQMPKDKKHGELQIKPSEESGLLPNPNDTDSFTPEYDLGTGVSQYIHSSNSAEQTAERAQAGMRLRISFSSPVKKSELEHIFRSISIQVDGQTAVSNGNTKTLSLNGKESTFSLLPPEPQKRRGNGIPQREGGKEMVYYEPDDTVNELLISFDAIEPVDLDIIIPAGTAAAAGLTTTCDHRHRISINPAAPELSIGFARLPLKGAHSFLIPALNVEKLEMKAWHLNAEQYLKMGHLLAELSTQPHHTNRLEELKYQLAVEEKRTGEDKERILKQLRSNIRQTEQQLLGKGLGMLALLPRLTAFEPQTISTEPTDSSILLYSRNLSVNLDTLTQGQTKPGFYIVSIRQKVAPAILRMLDKMGLDAGLFEKERFYTVQVTDLKASADEGLVILTRLSDGTTVAEGELISPSDEGKLPLRQGICRTGDWDGYTCIVRAGDDYTTVVPDSSTVSADTKLRMHMFADRPLYRPGDTVNLRGILRRVTAEGESRQAKEVRLLGLKVTRPNREILLQQDIIPDEFGAWAHSFQLPKGEEDITGRYRIEINSPQHHIENRNLFISCEVFRRDAFEASVRLEADTILPKTFTATVQATDLNGSPLSRADVKLKLTGHTDMLSLREGDKPSNELNLHLKTDEQGKAIICGRITPSFPEQMEGVAWISVSGSVVNDRQEYMKLPHTSHSFFAADFTPELHRSAIRLRDTSRERAILSREQALHVRILGQERQEECLPGGIILTKETERCFLEQDITIPANCEDGVPLPLADIANKPNVSYPLVICITATDAEGRKLSTRHRWYRWHDVSPNQKETVTAQDNTRISCRAENQTLKLDTRTHRPGEALLLLRSRHGIRPLTLQVKGGNEQHTIPLQEGENGTVCCQLFQTVADASGLFTEWVSDSADCFVPRPDMQLNISLTTPEQDVRPGAETELSGKVTAPDGSPVESAVTLFAVDKGMLSVSPYRLQNPEQIFGQVRLPQLYLSSNGSFRRQQKRILEPYLLPAVWNGEMIGAGRLLQGGHLYPVNSYRTGAAISYYRKAAAVEMDGVMEEGVEMDLGMGRGVGLGNGVEKSAAAPTAAPMVMNAVRAAGENAPAPRLRTDFAPVAVWQASLKTDAEGQFSAKVKLPDTLTTYRVYAVGVSRCWKRFGLQEGEFRVNQPVMITPGTPLFMSLGDCLRLPLTITNNTDKVGTWKVTLDGSDAPQSITLKAGSTGTLFFDFTAAVEGENTLRWTATAAEGGDAVEGKFPVRFPAPVLKENHHLVQAAGAEPLKLATLPAAELANSTRSSMQLELSANPLLHLASAMDFVLTYPYGCTEQTSSGLLPWIFHARLAPFAPTMQNTTPQEVGKVIAEAIEKLYKRQQADGGLGYWTDSKESCLWASAHAAMVFTIAEEHGIALPAEGMKKLRHYLSTRSEKEMNELSPYSRYSIGRACGNDALIDEALSAALEEKNKHPYGYRWHNIAETDIRFISVLRKNPAERHSAFLDWMRSRGHDYRHMTTWQNGWMLVALGEYLRMEPNQAAAATVQLQDGTLLTLSNGITRYTPPAGCKLGELPTTLTTTQGTAYLNVRFRALPEKTEYPGVTEKGLQVTRVYEKKDADGNWKPATEFCVGDVVRVTLTCAKIASELQYFVLEDYLPACMEAINPNVPSQAAGLELKWRPWSRWFDHKEYLADRVRGFCTHWGGRDILNMSYYARVKRAGISTAPPAEAQLMYEPQTYGLSPNMKIISK